MLTHSVATFTLVGHDKDCYIPEVRPAQNINNGLYTYLFKKVSDVTQVQHYT